MYGIVYANAQILSPIKQINAVNLTVGNYETGPAYGQAVIIS